ncbi:hypothetical protein CPC08DRAFT_139771 [Agrocybe pediades]|nr:hypothetical protein CPC08DRAFT_139771 [Agrocybe pediades]
MILQIRLCPTSTILNVCLAFFLTHLLTLTEFRHLVSGRHVDEMPEVPEFIGGQPAAMGKYEAVLHPVSSAQPTGGLGTQSIPRENPTEGVRMGPGYLGKPVDQEEFSSNIEQARRDIDRKLGVN